MVDVHYIGSLTQYDWCGEFFYNAMNQLSEHNLIKIELNQAKKLKNSNILFWNYQVINRIPFFLRRTISSYKRNKNTVLLGIRGGRTLNKFRNSLHNADAFLVNHDIKTQNLDPNKIYYCPDGVDEKLFIPQQKPEKLIVVWVGRSKKSFKGANIIRTLGVPYYIQTPERYLSHNLMPDFYNKGNVYICSSEQEGFGRGIIESAMCGLAIISTPVGIASEIVSDEYIVKGDIKNPDNYKVILSQLQDPEARRQIGLENRGRAMKFSWENVIPLWDKAISEVIQ